MNAVLQDLRFALRQLLRSPAFALTAILTLALGIGANTAIFSLLDQALLRALPVQDPGRLVVLEGTGTAWNGSFQNHGGSDAAYFSYPMYKDLRDQNKVFAGALATVSAATEILRNGASQLAGAELVSGNYFSLLGVNPALGRLFTQADDLQKDANPVAVLSFDFWKNHLGADPSIIGSTVSINGHPFSIVGVAPRNFRSAVWGETPGLFIPMAMCNQIISATADPLTDHTFRWINIVARLQPGISREQAEAAMNPLWHALRAQELKNMGIKSARFKDQFLTSSRIQLKPGARGFSYSRENYQTPLLAVMAMALLVLLIASVNVASLLLVRSASRIREFSLRFALGADATRIVQQLLLEGILIGVAGGVAGMLLAPVAIRALVSRLTSADGTVAFTSTIDARLLLFNFGIALAVAVLFSLAPTLQLRKPDLAAAMGQRTGTNSGALLSFRRAVVSLQIGLSVLLLVAAGLFVRTMQKLRAVDVGFTVAHLVTFSVDPKLAGYLPTALPGIEQRIYDNLAALPGTRSVAVTNNSELGSMGRYGSPAVSGYVAPPDENFRVSQSSVNPAFFATLQIPLVTGRLFTENDDPTHPLVALVNESFVKHFCKSPADCVGRTLKNARNTEAAIQIVGVVRDFKQQGVREPVEASSFMALKQDPDQDELFFYIRTAADPAQALATVRRSMQLLDPALALATLRTMDEQIDDNLSNQRMITLLAVSFGVLATLLAGIGLYGVLAYSTTQRTREIGIRIALGSTRVAVSRIILGDVLRLAGIGILVALPVAYGLSSLLRSQLYGVSAADPLTLLAAVVMIAVVALFSALLPALRAASINPTEALRTE